MCVCGGPALSGVTNRMAATTARHGEAGRLRRRGKEGWQWSKCFAARVWVRQAARSRSLIHVREPGWHEVFAWVDNQQGGRPEREKKLRGGSRRYPVDIVVVVCTCLHIYCTFQGTNYVFVGFKWLSHPLHGVFVFLLDGNCYYRNCICMSQIMQALSACLPG